MIDRIIEFDKHLMLLLNGWHSPFFDFLMPESQYILQYWLSCSARQT